MTTGDACQVDRKTKESEVDTASRAAVYGDAHAGDERGASRHQKADEIGDVLGSRDALERIVARRFGALSLDRRARRGRLLCDETLPARGGGRGRRHGGDENVRRRAEVGESLREVYEPRICDAARQISRSRIARGGADDVDDASPALRLHDRKD